MGVDPLQGLAPYAGDHRASLAGVRRGRHVVYVLGFDAMGADLLDWMSAMIVAMPGCWQFT